MNEDSWDGTPGEVIDDSGNNLNGVAVNVSDTIADGKLGRCGQLDGDNDYLAPGDCSWPDACFYQPADFRGSFTKYKITSQYKEVQGQKPYYQSSTCADHFP